MKLLKSTVERVISPIQRLITGSSLTGNLAVNPVDGAFSLAQGIALSNDSLPVQMGELQVVFGNSLSELNGEWFDDVLTRARASQTFDEICEIAREYQTELEALAERLCPAREGDFPADVTCEPHLDGSVLVGILVLLAAAALVLAVGYFASCYSPACSMSTLDVYFSKMSDAVAKLPEKPTLEQLREARRFAVSA